MKYALITPPWGFFLQETYNFGYHFVLAQYLNDPAYAEHYKRLAQRGHFILMDNGAAELGEGIPDDELMRAADALGADEVVMPDVLDNTKATLERTYAAHKRFPECMRAMCPQGTTWDEWEYCATVMLDMGCATLCVAKRYEALPGGRARALRIIESNRWHLDHNIHLLGCYHDPLKEIKAARKVAPWVRGIDTAAPIAFAQHERTFEETDEHFSLDWEGSMDYDAVISNIDAILEAVNGSL